MLSITKKIILVILCLSYFKIANAEISLSGYQEFFAGSADQTTANGVSEHGIDIGGGLHNGTYTRITTEYSSTLDSGIDVSGVYTIGSRDCRGSYTDNCDVTHLNYLSFSGGFGAIAIGEHFDVGASMLSRLTASVPTAEPDGANITGFYTTSAANNYGTANETAYASNSMKITYNSIIYNGFSFAIGYTPNTAETGTHDDAQATTIENSKYTTFSDVLTTIGKYSIAIDGIGLELAYGILSGNAGQVAGTNYNDLEETVYSALVTYRDFSIDYRKNESDNSGQEKNGQAGNDEGTSVCGMYKLGAIGLGACLVETSFTDTSNLSNDSKTRTYSADYSLGGGLTLGAVYFDVEQTANGAIQTDADGIMSMLSYGF